MESIPRTYLNGKFVPASPPDWPEGTLVMIAPIQDEKLFADHVLTEEEQGSDSESIARWIAWMDSFEPLIFTPEEEAEIEEARQERKKYTIENMDRGIDELFP